MKDYRRLLTYLRPYLWPHGVGAVVSMLLFSSLEGTVPFMIKYALDNASLALERSVLVQAVVVVFAVSILRGGLTLAAGYLTDWIGMRVVSDIRNELTAHMQQLDLAFFNRQRAGQIVSRVMADATNVRQTITDALTSVFQDLTRLLALAGGALYMDWRLALGAILMFPAAGAPLRYTSQKVRQLTRRQQERAGRMNAALHENIQGNRVVKVFGQEAFETAKLADHANGIFRIYTQAALVRALPITEVLGGFAIAGIIWFGGLSVIAQTRTKGDLGAFVVAIFLLYDPFKRLVKTNFTLQQGLASADRVFELLDEPSEILDRPDARVIDTFRDAIEFHDVCFRYAANRDLVLEHVDLRVPRGSIVALVGMSGGGKSTIADLIPRLYDVEAGRITIDGTDIRDVTRNSLRAQMAVVTQFTFLFNDTVRNNIAYGQPDRPMAEIEAAARAANAHAFILQLPQGYDTPVGDLGVRLSGGQRQRLAIARALLRNAPILILDEATSALDTESEGLVQDALDRLMENRTTLVVAHRLSTIRHATEIAVVSHGRIVERGTHDALLAHGGEYRKLYELQFGETESADARTGDAPALA